MAASSVCVDGALHPLLPVYTSAPFPKPRIRELLAELRNITVTAPVQMGQVILVNVPGQALILKPARIVSPGGSNTHLRAAWSAVYGKTQQGW